MSETRVLHHRDRSLVQRRCAGEAGPRRDQPVARTFTHLVVEPRHRRGTSRLVPIDPACGAGSTRRNSGWPRRPSPGRPTTSRRWTALRGRAASPH